MKRFIFVYMLLLGSTQPVFAASLVAGKAFYAVCAGCHGFEAEGKRDVGAPKLTGLETEYLARQLRYFEGGIRGGNAADSHGQRMAPFALALTDERAIEDVVGYIQTLAHVRPEPSTSGDTERGRQSYLLCTACHGPNGEGIEQLSSPRLSGLEDWYIVRQLELYRSGLRGSHAEDRYGQQMRPIVDSIQDEQEFADIAAYISELGSQP